MTEVAQQTGAAPQPKPESVQATLPSQANSEAPRDPKTRPSRSIHSYTRPRFNRILRVQSLQAQRVIDRSLDRVSHSLFSLDVILQIIGERDQVDEVETIITDHMEAAEEQLDNTLAQLQVLMKDNNIQQQPDYSHPREQEVEISSPQIGSFVRLVEKLDTLIMRLDTLWLCGVVKSKDRTRNAQQWQQHLNKLASRIIGVEKRARNAAHRAGMSDEVDAAAPESTHDDDYSDVHGDEDASETAAKAPAKARKTKETSAEDASEKDVPTPATAS